MNDDKTKLVEDKALADFDEATQSFQSKSTTDDFKEDMQRATEAIAAEVAAWKEFWEEWIPGGLRRRKRYRTRGHGLRRSTRRRQNRVARASRKRNRPHKKRSR